MSRRSRARSPRGLRASCPKTRFECESGPSLHEPDEGERRFERARPHARWSAQAAVAAVLCEHDRVRSRMDSELLENLGDVVANSLLADEELAADVQIRETAREQVEDLALAQREARECRIFG